MGKRIHPLAVSRPMPFKEHRSQAEVILTERLQEMAQKGPLGAPLTRQLQSLLDRATFPTCQNKEPEDCA